MSLRHSRRRLLGIGTTLAIVGSPSTYSWVQALADQGNAAFVGCDAFLGGKRVMGSKRIVLDLDGLVSPSRMTMNGRKISISFPFFGECKHRKRCLRAEEGTFSAVPTHWATSAGAGALSAVSLLLHDQPISFGGRQPFTSHAARWLIRRSIESRCKASAALSVEVEARSNLEAMIGRFDTVSVEFQELIFDDVQVTGGARFEILGVDFLTPGLLPGPMRRLRRLRRPCEVSGTSELTDADLAHSPAIRRLAQRVISHALRPRNKKGGTNSVSSVTSRAQGSSTAGGRGASAGDGWGEVYGQRSVLVSRVRMNGSRLAVEGEVASGGPFLGLPFRYEFSLGASRDGHVVHLKDPSVYWGTAGGWHVALPMLPLQSFNIDLGDRAKIERLRVSGGRLTVGGRFILSPVSPLMVSPGYSRGKIQHDLSETLSNTICNVLRFRRD